MPKDCLHPGNACHHCITHKLVVAQRIALGASRFSIVPGLALFLALFPVASVLAEDVVYPGAALQTNLLWRNTVAPKFDGSGWRSISLENNTVTDNSGGVAPENVLGVSWKPASQRGLYVDLDAQGYVGKREGVTANLIIGKNF